MYTDGSYTKAQRAKASLTKVKSQLLKISSLIPAKKQGWALASFSDQTTMCVRIHTT